MYLLTYLVIIATVDWLLSGRSCLKIFQKLLSAHSDVDPLCDGLIEKSAFIFLHYLFDLN